MKSIFWFRSWLFISCTTTIVNATIAPKSEQATSLQQSTVSWHLWLRNDSIFSSKEFTDQTLNDLFAYHPRAETLNLAGNDVTQRPLASILNIAPMAAIHWSRVPVGRYFFDLYLDCGLFPYGMYLSQDTFLENLSNEFELLINFAYVDIYNERHKVRIGQYLNPLVPVNTLPHIVSMNMGALIAPTALNPEVRYEFTDCGTTIAATAFLQYLYQNDGPLGFSTTYMRNSQLPGFAVGIAKQVNPTTELGVIAETKRLIPLQAIENPLNFSLVSVSNAIQTYILSLWLTISQEKFTLKTQVLGGQNGNDLMNLGGYSINSYAFQTGKVTYAPIWYYSFWADLETTALINCLFQPGIFVGITKNLGARHPVALVPLNGGTIDDPVVVYYGFKDNFGTALPITGLFRCAPRCWFMVNDQVNIGVEVEYTTTMFGNLQQNGSFTDNNRTSLLRFVVSTQFYL
ncbi:hypothetical protein M1466_01505 [Candidatus Dependentiae bacterium]|nr:hypothetical protein [Candidatus Dependentiae bacterium]